MGSGVGMPAALKLNAFGRRIAEAFGHHPYQVGSSVVGREWRDVDVRLMLPDEEFDLLFPNHRTPPHADPKWALLCEALSDLARAQTGLPVDFQIQRTTEANAEFDGPRSALGVRMAECCCSFDAPARIAAKAEEIHSLRKAPEIAKNL